MFAAVDGWDVGHVVRQISVIFSIPHLVGIKELLGENDLHRGVVMSQPGKQFLALLHPIGLGHVLEQLTTSASVGEGTQYRPPDDPPQHVELLDHPTYDSSLDLSLRHHDLRGVRPDLVASAPSRLPRQASSSVRQLMDLMNEVWGAADDVDDSDTPFLWASMSVLHEFAAKHRYT